MDDRSESPRTAVGARSRCERAPVKLHVLVGGAVAARGDALGDSDQQD
jgi:hypothetical protein